MAKVESGFDSRAVSPKGACGVMQVMPETAALYGVTRKELFDEDINIQVGLHYIRDLLDLFGNTNLALAAYNCGPTAVMDAGNRIPRIEETRNYVRRVNYEARRYAQNTF